MAALLDFCLAGDLEMTSSSLVKMRKAAISNVQHFRPCGGTAPLDIAGRPKP